ncbi:MAG TPA: hypothetical protein PLO61_05380 [Fimbriimonadaceae bacterium]|nr:hypothetical protein [Fimbriimonadaceae bacterium]HRJ33057.1 hypothetical protein [Fimbriimonadaceae bacterium]
MVEANELISSLNLVGTDEAVLDDKGRLLFSKKKRDALGENFVLAQGPLSNLVLYPANTWAELVADFGKYERLNFGRQQYTRLLFGTAAADLKFDGQGRLVIPAKLREKGKIKEKDKVLLIGCGDYIEIWSETEWEKFNEFPEVYGRERREALDRAYSQMKDSQF